jgi:hypothetical protein
VEALFELLDQKITFSLFEVDLMLVFTFIVTLNADLNVSVALPPALLSILLLICKLVDVPVVVITTLSPLFKCPCIVLASEDPIVENV